MIPTDERKEVFIQALSEQFGIVTAAAKKAGTSAQMHYRWMIEDADYRARVTHIQEKCLDLAESRILKLINDGDPKTSLRAAMFYLEKRGRSRGYGAKLEVTTQQAQFIAPDQYSAEAWEEMQQAASHSAAENRADDA